MSTPHTAAAAASPVTTMKLPSDSAPGLGGPYSPADLVRGASTTVPHATSRNGHRAARCSARRGSTMGAGVRSGGTDAERGGAGMSLGLLDWRRRVARLYAEVRAEPDVVVAHGHWRRTRDDLLRTHPESPVPEAQVAAYDPRLRFDVTLDTGVPPQHMDVSTGTDGTVRFDRIGCVHLPGGGD